MEELKKLLAGFSVLETSVKVATVFALILSLSLVIPTSPSKAPTPSFARTGKGAGSVTKPLILMSAVTFPCTPAYPSKVEMNFPGMVGFS
ncbi:hypothetical protein D3C86_1468080 [compost metagenome]